jgi:hypothetical protein
MSHVVAVYDCYRSYGGSEEGGWWYDTGELCRIVKVFKSEDKAYEYSRRLNAKLRSRAFGPNQGKRELSSVLSDGEYQALVFEDTCPRYFPEGRPRYE